MQKQCKICKTKLVGRSDKKFCSVQCKNTYHAKLAAVTLDAAKKIDNILHRNRSILLELLGKHNKMLKIPRLALDAKRFNFTYHTHIYVNAQQKTYHFVYDIAWMEFSDSEVMILRKKTIE